MTSTKHTAHLVRHVTIHKAIHRARHTRVMAHHKIKETAAQRHAAAVKGAATRKAHGHKAF